MESVVEIGKDSFVLISESGLTNMNLFDCDAFGDYENRMEINIDLANHNINLIEVIALKASNMHEDKVNLPDKKELKKINFAFYIKDNSKEKDFKFYFNKEEVNIVIGDTSNIDSYFEHNRVEYYYNEFELVNIRITDISAEEYNTLSKFKNDTFDINTHERVM